MEEIKYLDQLVDFAWQYGPKFLGGILLLLCGLWIIRRLTRAFNVFLNRRKVDESLLPFFSSLADTGMKVLLIFMVANTVGIETTSFIAIFSAVAFSVGLALQGSLGNFASGVLILLFKPYRVGDLITVGGMTGHVLGIQIFNTILVNDHGKKIIIPNAKMTEGPIENIEMDRPVQVEIALLLDSESDMKAVRAAANVAAQNCPWRLGDRDTEVVLSGVNRDDMKAEIAWWTLGEHYSQTADYMHEALKTAFEAQGVKLAKERRKETK